MFSWISSQLTGGSFYSNDPSPMNPDQGNSETKSHMDLDEKSLPPPERPRLSSKSSSLTLDRTHPSNISWIPSNGSSASVPGTPKSLTFPNGTPSIHTPSPEPSLTRGGFLASLRRPTGQKPSSESLRLPQDRARVSWDPKEEKTLSPIEEREHEQSVSDATATLHFPSGSTRRPSVDSMPKTPDSASLPAFLTRRLNRSISHSSQNSAVSAQAPSIPPIDLRPSFPPSNGSLGVTSPHSQPQLQPQPHQPHPNPNSNSNPHHHHHPHPHTHAHSQPTRKSNLALSTLPTVVGSPVSHVTVISEGPNQSKMSVASSFRTAGSRPHLPHDHEHGHEHDHEHERDGGGPSASGYGLEVDIATGYRQGYGNGHGQMYGLGLQHDVPEDVDPDEAAAETYGHARGPWRMVEAEMTYEHDSDTDTLERASQQDMSVDEHHDDGHGHGYGHDHPPAYQDEMEEVDLGRPPERASWYTNNPFADPDGHILEHHNLHHSQRDFSSYHSGRSSFHPHPSGPYAYIVPDPPIVDVEQASITSSAATRVDFAIHSRWLKDQGYPASHITCPPKSENKRRTTAAFVLFWIGFIAPWCWLIGGWCLSESGALLPDGPYLHAVDQYYPKGGMNSKVNGTKTQHYAQEPTRNKGPGRKRGFVDKLKTYWRPRSVHTLPITMKDVEAYRQGHPQLRVGKESSSGTPNHTASDASEAYVCPWVRRCRIAAFVGGAILLFGVIVALVVLAAISRPHYTSTA